MTDRDRIAEIIRNARMNADPLSQVGYAEADALLANGVILPPCKVGDMVDKVLSHNSIIAIWVEIPKEHYSQRLWRGIAWDIPEKYKEMQFKRIFGSIPESIYEADTINVLAEITKEEAEAKLKELGK